MTPHTPSLTSLHFIFMITQLHHMHHSYMLLFVAKHVGSYMCSTAHCAFP